MKITGPLQRSGYTSWKFVGHVKGGGAHPWSDTLRRPLSGQSTTRAYADPGGLDVHSLVIYI